MYINFRSAATFLKKWKTISRKKCLLKKCKVNLQKGISIKAFRILFSPWRRCFKWPVNVSIFISEDGVTAYFTAENDVV